MFLIFLNKNSIEHSIIHFTVYNRLLYITENFYDVTNIHRIGKTRGLNRYMLIERLYYGINETKQRELEQLVSCLRNHSAN